MPLLDHFHAPLFPQRSWESFHSRWANSMADALQRILPERYFAEVQMHLGSQVEADVAEFEGPAATPANGTLGGVAVQTWAPPAATMVMPAVFPDDLAVQVRDEFNDARLVGVVELVSPRNKDRAESRRAFAAKCAAYLQRGIGLVMVDIVTSRLFNLHNELVQLLALTHEFDMAADPASLYATAYHPLRRQENNVIDMWPFPLAIGASLPVAPLVLRGGPVIPLDLEATYLDARQRSRL
jgi:hypothetical protein